eukprot:3151496-Prymnesium_polylepis.1
MPRALRRRAGDTPSTRQGCDARLLHGFGRAHPLRGLLLPGAGDGARGPGGPDVLVQQGERQPGVRERPAARARFAPTPRFRGLRDGRLVGRGAGRRQAGGSRGAPPQLRFDQQPLTGVPTRESPHHHSWATRRNSGTHLTSPNLAEPR